MEISSCGLDRHVGQERRISELLSVAMGGDASERDGLRMRGLLIASRALWGNIGLGNKGASWYEYFPSLPLVLTTANTCKQILTMVWSQLCNRLEP